MRFRMLAVVLLGLLVLAAPSAQAQVSIVGPGEQAVAAAKAKKKAKAKKRTAKAKRKRCRKGYVLRTVKVKRKGRTVRVKRCRKRPARKRRAVPPTAPAPTPGGPSAPLGDDAARKLLEEKLADTRFTNCPEGLNLVTCFQETRYSHFADGRFAYCRLTPGPERTNDTVYSTFQIRSARLETDGSLSFDAVVPDHGTYRWRVGTDGQVTGSVQLAGEDKATTLFALKQLPGARDCTA